MSLDLPLTDRISQNYITLAISSSYFLFMLPKEPNFNKLTITLLTKMRKNIGYSIIW